MKHLTSSGKLAVLRSPLSRRRFLRFAGGAVALPLLPSLFRGRLAHAADDDHAFRRALFMVNKHGGHSSDVDPVGVDYVEQAPGVRVGDLRAGSLGPIYPDELDQLKSKLTVIRGLDSLSMNSHCLSAVLAGCEFDHSNPPYGANDERTAVLPDSIDVVLGRSSRVYEAPPPIRVLRLANGGGSHSHCFENYQSLSALSDPQAAADLVMANIVASDGTDEPTPNMEEIRRRRVMERALLALEETRNNPHIGSQDRIHLESYQTILAALRDDVSTENAPPPQSSYQCGSVELSGDESQRMAQVMVAALACGVTKVGYMSYPAEHYYVHRVFQEENRRAHVAYLRDRALPVCSYTMKLMDEVMESNGRTLLDNSAVLVTSEIARSRPHSGLNMRVLLGGSLNGLLRTGLAIDYQDTRHEAIADGQTELVYAGRYYNSLLVTLLKGFGLTPSEYVTQPGGGFGSFQCTDATRCADVATDDQAALNFARKLFAHYDRHVAPGYDRDGILAEYASAG